jgi:hypothetical protein
MCLIFDAVDPCRKFKRGAAYDPDAEEPFADYEPNYEEDPNVTDTDEGDDEKTMAMPYLAIDFKYVYLLHCTFRCSP